MSRLRSDSKVFVAGHNGMVGSAIVRQLQATGLDNILTANRAELDLRDQAAVRSFFEQHRPDIVVLAAAKVGGIFANNEYPAEFLHENLVIQCNIIDSAYRAGAENLLFLGSSCIYPKLASQPMHEDALLTGKLEPTNEPYAIAKIAGIKMCESYNRQYGTDYRSVMPTNLYGPGDNYHGQNSHVIPALIKKFHQAKLDGADRVEIWGTGSPRREFLHVDDLAAACLFVMHLPREEYALQTEPMSSHLNVGTGEDVTIRELGETIQEITQFGGQLVFDTSKPDGTPRKLLDVSKLRAMGWTASIELKQGLQSTYQDFLASAAG